MKQPISCAYMTVKLVSVRHILKYWMPTRMYAPTYAHTLIPAHNNTRSSYFGLSAGGVSNNFGFLQPGEDVGGFSTPFEKSVLSSIAL
jgi:hypothetical protein